MSINIQTEGRRHYITGHTYAVRDQIRALGAHWDAARKAWWTAKAEQAQSLVSALNTQQAAAAQQERAAGIALTDRAIRGRAKYKGREYYLLASGISKTGKPYAKLASKDGTLVFWAKEGEPVHVVKSYDDATSIQALRDFAARRKAEGDSGLSYSGAGPRTGCSCGSRENYSQPTDCASCQFDQDDN